MSETQWRISLDQGLPASFVCPAALEILTTCSWWFLGQNCFQNICHKLARKDISKAIPLQAWTGHESSRRLRLQNFLTVSK